MKVVPTLSRASLAPTADINVKWEQTGVAIHLARDRLRSSRKK
jgi:hypothetical protein